MAERLLRPWQEEQLDFVFETPYLKLRISGCWAWQNEQQKNKATTATP